MSRNIGRRAVLVCGAAASLAGCAGYGPGRTTAAVPVAAGGARLATTADIPVGSGVIFAGQDTVVTQPAAGEFRAFTATCTHQGCLVATVTDTIDCTCHGSTFALADGAVLAGPAPAPLAAKAITVTDGAITLA